MQREILDYFLVYFSMLCYVKNNKIDIVIETIFPFFVDELCVKIDFFRICTKFTIVRLLLIGNLFYIHQTILSEKPM